MSRIGKAPINIPAGVEIKVAENNVVSVKGPNGELHQQIDSDMKVNVADGEMTVERPTNQKRHRSLHGLYRSLLHNMVIGVSEGFTLELELVGVGYRANTTGQLLELSLGYSHPVYFSIPEEVKVEAVMEKGKNPAIILKSSDKQLIGHVAAKIRAFRKPEPYKGKGIKFKGEEIRRKAGKAAGAA